jgi:hypothetical protein
MRIVRPASICPLRASRGGKAIDLGAALMLISVTTFFRRNGTVVDAAKSWFIQALWSLVSERLSCGIRGADHARVYDRGAR